MDRNKFVMATVAGGAFLLFLAFVINIAQPDDEQEAIAKQLAYEKWSRNDLFMNTLERYNEVYRRLDRRSDKEALALAYVKMITKDLFLFTSKNRDSPTLSVLLPAAKEGDIDKPFVLQQIYIGADNGIHDALKFLVDSRRRSVYQPPPFYSPDTERLMEYIKTGEQPSSTTLVTKASVEQVK